MADFQEFNIFGGSPASFRTALPTLAAVRSFVLPVTREDSGGLELHALLPLLDGGRQRLQAFTDETALSTPFIKYQPLETALVLFHAPRNDSFSFDPGLSRPTSVSASRAEISRLAGCLQAGDTLATDPLREAAAEFSLGNLHKAHFYYAMEAEKSPVSPARLPLCAVLVELGLFQEAYDALKAEKAPEALLLMAAIYRRTGNPQRAAEALAAIDRGTPQEEGKAAETAWLHLAAEREEEAEKEFERLAASASIRAEALSGLGAVRAKKAFRTRDPGLLAGAEAAFEAAAASPSPAVSRIFFQLGNIYFRSGNLAKAEFCYKQTAARAPGLQALSNLAATLTRTGKFQEAEAITARIALTDAAAAKQLAVKLRSEKDLSPQDRQAARSPEPAGPAGPAPAGPPDLEIETFPVAPPPPPTGFKSPSSMPGQASLEPAAMLTPPRTFFSGNAAVRPAGINLDGPPAAQPPFSPTQEQAPAGPAARQELPQAFPSMQTGGRGLDLQSMQDVMRSVPDFSSQERRPEDFMSGAFRVASLLERESGKKVNFNAEGLAAIEARLRVAFSGDKSEAELELAKDSAAFLCYFLKERYSGVLIKLPQSEPWCWPMVFERAGRKFTTYPAQRAWRLVLGEGLPDRGWLVRYGEWVVASLQETAALPSGTAAVKSKTPSHPERLTDTLTEHRRIMVLASTLSEISGIEPVRSGLIKLETVLKNNFRPNIPPSADGWRLLRCCGHVLAEIFIRDFKAAWYNTDGEDGFWSMRLPWGTFVFPLGKIYRVAAAREDLGEYYAALLSEKKSRE